MLVSGLDVAEAEQVEEASIDREESSRKRQSSQKLPNVVD